MLGRLANGDPVVFDPLMPGRRPPPRQNEATVVTPAYTSTPGGAKAFDFHDDHKGMACPFGAHIRRMNPRNDPVVPLQRRPLLRRGTPYTYEVPKVEGQENQSDSEKSKERGMLGLFFCSNLEEQFEHLLGQWANNMPMGLPHHERGKDPLIGSQDAIVPL